MNDHTSPIRHRSRAAAATVAALALLLIPTLACAGTETSGTAPGRAQGDLLGMLPAEVVNVGFLDYAALRNSPFFSSIQDDENLSLDALDELDEFIDRTGMDPRTDIHQVAFVTGTIGGGADNEGGFVAVADFDRDRVIEALGDFESMQYAERTVWVLRDRDLEEAMTDGEDATDADQEDAEDGGDRVSGYLTILSDDTIAAGSRTMVERIIDVSMGAASARTNQALEGLIEDVDPNSELWFVSAQDRLVSDMAPRADGAPMPQIPVDKIRSLIFSARFSDGLALQLRGRTEAESDAKLLGDSLNGMLAFGKMMVQSNAPEIFAILDEGIRAGSSGRDVTLRASLTVEQIDQLRAYAERTFGDAMEEQIGD